MLGLRDGDPMDGPAGISLPEAPEGGTVRLVLRLRAPRRGKAFAVWSLADAERVPFGVLFWVDAQVDGPWEEVPIRVDRMAFPPVSHVFLHGFACFPIVSYGFPWFSYRSYRQMGLDVACRQRETRCKARRTTAGAVGRPSEALQRPGELATDACQSFWSEPIFQALKTKHRWAYPHPRWPFETAVPRLLRWFFP